MGDIISDLIIFNPKSRRRILEIPPTTESWAWVNAEEAGEDPGRPAAHVALHHTRTGGEGPALRGDGRAGRALRVRQRVRAGAR